MQGIEYVRHKVLKEYPGFNKRNNRWILNHGAGHQKFENKKVEPF